MADTFPRVSPKSVRWAALYWARQALLLAVGGTEGMVLVVLKAGPESPDAARLAELAHR